MRLGATPLQHRLLSVSVARFFVLVAVAAIVGGCSLRGDDDANGGLAFTSWTVLSISGVPTVGPTRPTMTFDPGGTLSGSTGCNQYSAAFRTDGATIRIAQSSSTAAMCVDGNIALQETAFLDQLQGATAWRQTEDGNLVLTGAGEIIAGPGVVEGPPDQAPIAELAGTAWTLAEMGGTADFAGLVPTLEFRQIGDLAGFAGCNQFSGSYTVTGGDLSLGPIASTKMGCEPPASAVEARYLAALAAVAGWSVDGSGRLTLHGPLPLTFAPG